MTFKVLVATRSFGSTSQAPWDVLKDAGVEYTQADMSQEITEDALIDLLHGIDGAIIGVVPMTARVLENAPHLKVVSFHGVGVDHIDLKAASRLGITVANCPGTNGQAVADLTIGMMIAVARAIPAADQSLRQGEWGRYSGSELWEKTLGLIGLGNIGQAVAKRATGFNMKILAYDPFIELEGLAIPNVQKASLEDLLEASDFVSLHAALNTQTKNMIGRDQLAWMKRTAFLVNTSRGGLVDEEALYQALVDKQIAGAALDTFVNEPPTGSPLLTLKNVVVTPHIGAHTREAIERAGVTAALNVVRTLQGGQPLHRVSA